MIITPEAGRAAEYLALAQTSASHAEDFALFGNSGAALSRIDDALTELTVARGLLLPSE